MHYKPLLFSLVLTTAPNAGAQLIDFESETVGATPAGWAFSSDSSNVQIANTVTSGDYLGGQAIRTDEGGSSIAGFPLPGPTITSIQGDFRWDVVTTNTPTLTLFAWDDDDNDGFQAAERTIGFGLDNDGQFELTSDSGEIAGTVNFVADTWYRLTMTWSDPDGVGNRTVTLSALDLTNSNPLGVVATATLTAAEFGVAPSEWDGIAFRMTRGTIDNIQTTTTGEPEPEPEPEPPTGPKHRDIFLIGGQSNADGRGLISELTGDFASYAGPQNDIIINYSNLSYVNPDRSLIRTWVTLNPGFSRAPRFDDPLLSETFGMEIGAGRILSQHYPNPAFIKVTEGGTALGRVGIDWSPPPLDSLAPLDSPDTGPLYIEFITATRAALAALDAAGDTYTIRGMFWHQGESDGSRVDRYEELLTTLIASIRRDLELPNLRFIIGELEPTRDPQFLDAQWQVSRDVPNAEFISSRGLITTDGTHFNTASMLTYGERLGNAFIPDRSVLAFDQPVYFTDALDRQDEWSAASELVIAATAAQGEYTGGQAAGLLDVTGTFTANRRNMLPLASARSMQADFFAGDTDSSLLVAGWLADANGNLQFSENETAIGLGLDSTGTFRVQVGSQSNLTSSFNYQADRWYRLTLTWSEPDANGQRSVDLFARDLSTSSDLNAGNSLMTLTTSAAEFAGTPVNWAGVGTSTSRGLLDNIQVSPFGFNAWAALFHPTLAGDPTGDDDQDGIANAIEFAFGLDPLSFNATSDLPQPVFGTESATVSFTPQVVQPGTLYQIESSTDLTTWTLVPGTQSGSLLNFTIPATDGSMFLRYRITVTE